MSGKSQKLTSTKFDNISLTAYRIISIFNMLMEAPCNDREINNKLGEKIENFRDLSNDTICIYLNTLRVLGCTISRPTRNNGFKYTLASHPFNLSLTPEEAETLMEIRKNISLLGDWKAAVEIDTLYDTIYRNSSPETQKHLSAAKKNHLKREMTTEKFSRELKKLESYCKKSKTVTLLYNSPESSEKNITLKAEKIIMENGAFYLSGYNEELETNMHLRLDRIISVRAVSLQNTKINPKSITVKYRLTGNSYFSPSLSENDTVIEKNSDELVVQTSVTNKFKFFQQIMSYGSECTVIEPEEIQKEIRSKLKNILGLHITASSN